MSFGPPKGVEVGGLTAATPTPFDVETLKTQLVNIGLDCAELNKENLQSYIDQVDSQLDEGSVQSMGIFQPDQNHAAVLASIPDVTSLAAAVPSLKSVATGNWTIDNSAEGFSSNLEVIQYPTHFKWLADNKATNGFTGKTVTPPTKTGNFKNADAIKKLFVDVGLTASSSLVKGLDKPTMKSVLSNVISPLKDSDLNNYNVTDSRVIFLVDNYDPTTKRADGVGVLHLGWTLIITDWKRKTKDGGDTHPVVLSFSASSVLYDNPKNLCADYNAVLDHFGINKSTAPSCTA